MNFIYSGYEKELYLVCSSTGEYDDYMEHPLKVFKTLSKAEKFAAEVDEANRMLREDELPMSLERFSDIQEDFEEKIWNKIEKEHTNESEEVYESVKEELSKNFEEWYGVTYKDYQIMNNEQDKVYQHYNGCNIYNVEFDDE